MLIALIGPSGSGKSSTGAALASKLGCLFIDSDRKIEADAGITIASIFANSGEAEFRKKETELLTALTEDKKVATPRLILSTGGGMPCSEANWNLLASLAEIIYLTAPAEVLVKRIKFGEERPLLSVNQNEQADEKSRQTAQIEKLAKLISERESFYNRARYKIDTSDGSPEYIADEIIRLLSLV